MVSDLFLYEKTSKNIAANFDRDVNFERKQEKQICGVAARELKKSGRVFVFSTKGLDENFAAEARASGIDLPQLDMMGEEMKYVEPTEEFDGLELQDIEEFVVEIISRTRKKKYVSSIPYVDFAAGKTTKEIIVSDTKFRKVEVGYSIYLYLKVENRGDTQGDGWFLSEKKLQDIDLDFLIERAYDRAERKIGAKAISSKKVPVIFSTNVMTDFLDVICSMLDFDRIIKKKSPYFSMLNKSVSSSDLSIVLKTAPELFYSAPFDDEGVAHKNFKIIDRGILRDFFKDRYTSLLSDEQSNGFGFRPSYNSETIRSATNIMIELPAITWDEALHYDKEIVVITGVSGLHTIDEVTGSFSLGFEGLYYKRGKFTHALNSMTLAGNIMDLLMNIVAGVGGRERIGNIYTPACLFKELVIGG